MKVPEVFKNSNFFNALTVADRIAISVIIVLSVLIFVLGTSFHPIPDPQSAERDGYIVHADTLREGKLPKDVFRPLLYPILTAAAGTLFNDSFAGGRVVSQVLAIFLLIFTYKLAKEVFNQWVGLVCLILLGLNQWFFWYSSYVTTEMTFATFSLITIFFAVSLLKNYHFKNILFVSLFFSLSYFTRYTAVALVPAICLGILLGAKGAGYSKKKIITGILLFFILSILFLLPHFIITTINFGHPFYNENYRNVAYKLYGKNNWAKLFTLPYQSLKEVILNDPGKFIASGKKEFFKFMKTAGQLTRVPPVNWQIFSGIFILGVLFVIPGGIIKKGVAPPTNYCSGSGKSHREENGFQKNKVSEGANKKNAVSQKIKVKCQSLIVLFVLSYAFLISLTFLANDRILLPALPFIYVIIAGFIFQLKEMLPQFKYSRYIGYFLIFVLFIVISLHTKNLYHSLDELYSRHPINETRAALRLQEKYGTGIRVGFTTMFLDRHVEFAAVDLGGTFGKPRNLGKYFKKLRRLVIKKDLDFIIVGRIGLFHRPKELLRNKKIPPFLQALEVTEDYAIYRVVK